MTAPSQPSSRRARRSSRVAIPPAAITGRPASGPRQQLEVRARRAIRRGCVLVTSSRCDAGFCALPASSPGVSAVAVQPSRSPSRRGRRSRRRSVAEPAAAAVENPSSAAVPTITRARRRRAPPRSVAGCGSRRRPGSSAPRRCTASSSPGSVGPRRRRRGRRGAARWRLRPRSGRGRYRVAALDSHAVAAALEEAHDPPVEDVDRRERREGSCQLISMLTWAHGRPTPDMTSKSIPVSTSSPTRC